MSVLGNLLGLKEEVVFDDNYVKPTFDIFREVVPSLNSKSDHLLDDDITLEKDYNSFMVNRVYSNYMDTLLYANEMNIRHELPAKLQYDFYFYGLEKKRYPYNKWVKKDTINNLELVKTFYKCTTVKALQYLKFLTKEHIEAMQRKLGHE